MQVQPRGREGDGPRASVDKSGREVGVAVEKEEAGPGRRLIGRAVREREVGSQKDGGHAGRGGAVAHQVAAFAGWARAMARGSFCDGRPRLGNETEKRLGRFARRFIPVWRCVWLEI